MIAFTDSFFPIKKLSCLRRVNIVSDAPIVTRSEGSDSYRNVILRNSVPSNALAALQNKH